MEQTSLTRAQLQASQLSALQANAPQNMAPPVGGGGGAGREHPGLKVHAEEQRLPLPDPFIGNLTHTIAVSSRL